MAKALLHAGKHRAIVASLDVDDAVGRETSLGKRRGEQVRTHDAPQDFALGPGGDAGGEERRGGAVERPVSSAGDLMERSQREPAPGQARVNGREFEGQHRIGATTAAFDGGDPLAKCFDGRLRSHASTTSRVVVPCLF